MRKKEQAFTLLEIMLVVTIIGIDGTSAQTIFARHVYDCEKDLVFGARLADLLRPLGNGKVQLDLAKFDAIVPAPL